MGVVTCMWGTLDVMFKVILGSFGVLVSKWSVAQNGVRGHFGVIWCTCLKWSVTLKWVKRAETWDLGRGGSCDMYMGYLRPLVFKVILRSFSALVSKLPLARKQLALNKN